MRTTPSSNVTASMPWADHNNRTMRVAFVGHTAALHNLFGVTKENQPLAPDGRIKWKETAHGTLSDGTACVVCTSTLLDSNECLRRASEWRCDEHYDLIVLAFHVSGLRCSMSDPIFKPVFEWCDSYYAREGAWGPANAAGSSSFPINHHAPAQVQVAVLLVKDDSSWRSQDDKSSASVEEVVDAVTHDEHAFADDGEGEQAPDTNLISNLVAGDKFLMTLCNAERTRVWSGKVSACSRRSQHGQDTPGRWWRPSATQVKTLSDHMTKMIEHFYERTCPEATLAPLPYLLINNGRWRASNRMILHASLILVSAILASILLVGLTPSLQRQVLHRFFPTEAQELSRLRAELQTVELARRVLEGESASLRIKTQENSLEIEQLRLLHEDQRIKHEKLVTEHSTCMTRNKYMNNYAEGLEHDMKGLCEKIAQAKCAQSDGTESACCSAATDHDFRCDACQRKYLRDRQQQG